jgi:hypothetical protein
MFLNHDIFGADQMTMASIDTEEAGDGIQTVFLMHSSSELNGMRGLSDFY